MYTIHNYLLIPFLQVYYKLVTTRLLSTPLKYIKGVQSNVTTPTCNSRIENWKCQNLNRKLS